jgi:heme/copper-type cytochrome/quinol oxidase subunit 2
MKRGNQRRFGAAVAVALVIAWCGGASAQPVPVTIEVNESANGTLLVLWIGVAALVLLFGLLLFALLDRAKHEDRVARHTQHTISPFDEITITKPGE